MENEIKAKFFALYLGHKCRIVANNTINDMFPPYKVTGRVIEVVADGKYPDAFLELRSIADLTDGEKQVIAKLSYFGESTNVKQVDILFESYLNKQSIVTGNQWWFIKDYLRSIGILLPFTYLNEQNEPITLTPKDIIERGWVKVK